VNLVPGVEVQFWIDLIKKYLEPLKKDVEKEKKQAAGLLDLRNKMVFSFFMLNAIFVVTVFLMQSQKDVLYIRWPLGAKANVTYGGTEASQFLLSPSAH
jgi:chitin synthase